MESFRLAALCLLLACSCGEESSAPGDAGDGKVHPPTNGVRMAEADACGAIENALRDRAFALGCSMTLRPCPELLRVQFTTPCMQYDQGTVEGCASYFQARTSCGELAVDVCVVVPYPGSEPAGCP